MEKSLLGCLLCFVLFFSGQILAAEEPEKPSFDHLMQKIDPYTDRDEAGEFDRKTAINIVETYISKHRDTMSKHELIHIYSRVFLLYTVWAPFDRRDKKKAYQFGLKGIRIGKPKISSEKLNIIGYITFETKPDFPSRSIQRAGYHQFCEFINVIPNWYLREYRMAADSNVFKKNSGMDTELVRSFTLKYSDPESVISYMKNSSERVQSGIAEMYHPLIMYSKRANASTKIPSSNQFKEPETYRQKLKNGELVFTKKRLNTMEKLGYAHEGAYRFRWLAGTHLLCGFLRTLSDRRLEIWIDEKKVVKTHGGTKEKALSAFRRFCKAKQAKLAPHVYQAAKQKEALRTWLKVVYAPGYAFTKRSMDEAEKYVEKIREKINPPAFDEDSSEK